MPDNSIILNKKIKLAAANNGSKVIIGSSRAGRNMQLVKAIARSFLWNEQLLKGERTSFQDIGNHEKISSSTYVSKIVRLRFLAPDIIESILNGSHSADWTVEKLFKIKALDWNEQRQTLGLA